MIKKFIKISGTGKFLNYNHSSVPGTHRTTDFEKINLIYGENGIGKTTLSIVLSSLKGDNNLLLKKRSFNKIVPQTIEVLTDVAANPKLTFANNAWDFHYPNIEIFDIHFINENIYTGSEIQTIHKKNLFEVIFGQQGINLKTDIQNIKDRIKSGTKVIKDTAEKIELAIGNAYSAENYCAVATDILIDTKIANKEAEITTAKSYQLIQQKELLKTIPLLTYPFDMEGGISAIEKSIDNISAEFLAKYKAHRDHLEIEHAEDWLKKGFEAIQDNSCPFCLRPFDETVEIIEAYNQYFNVEYNSLLKKIQEISSKSGQYSLEAQFLTIENGILLNNNLIGFWKTYLDQEPTEFSATGDKEELIEEFETVKALIRTKIQSPIISQSSSILLSLSSKILAFNQKVISFNTDIVNYNARITTLKTSRQANLQLLEVELSRLKAVKKRSDPTISTHCTNYLTYKQAVQTLRTQKDAKQQLLDTHSTRIFANYTTKINQYLRIFAPYLEIRGLDSAYVGSSTEPIVKYALHIDGNEIKQEDSQTLPTFKYSLSEGDKSALALAFFLAKLEVDLNLQDKIRVFDDPVHSFDLNRIKIIKAIYVIV